MTLVYVHDQKNDPICYVNVTPKNPAGLDCDGAAYILMVTFINHLGMMYNGTKEEAV